MSDVEGFSVLHFTQGLVSAFPHFAQKLFAEELFVPHFEQRISLPAKTNDSLLYHARASKGIAA
jgi:hypothetical protein